MTVTITAILFAVSFVPVSRSSTDVPSDFFSFETSVSRVPGKVAARAGDSEIFGQTEGVLPSKDYQLFTSIFPLCLQNRFGNCIQSLEYRKLGSKTWKKGSPLGELVTEDIGRPFIYSAPGKEPNVIGFTLEDTATGIPAGGAPSIWNLAEALHKGGTRYLVSVAWTSLVPNSEPNWLWSSQFSIFLRPFSPIASTLARVQNPEALTYQFPKGFEYRLKIRLGLANGKIGTFFFGRLNNPSIDLSEGVLTVTGSPESSPLAQSNFLEYQSLSDNIKKTIPQDPRIINIINERGTWGPFAGEVGAVGRNIFEDFLAWESSINQVGTNSAWYLKSQNFDTYSCALNSISGLVSSNSMLYSFRPPSWDSATKTISYQMASTHQNESGELNRGNFNLLISNPLMRCLWKFTPDQSTTAEVQVTYDNGKSTLATSKVSVSKNWLSLQIGGYNFSSPKIAIAFSRSASCIKGSKKRIIKGQNPKCPKGWTKT